MRTRSMARRSVALVATTALMSGGLASGFLATAAYAVVPATVTTVTPTEWDNRSAKSVTVFGSGFATGDRIVFTPYCSVAGVTQENPCPPLTGSGPEVGDFSAQVGGAVAPTADSISATVNFAKAPPGKYRVFVRHQDGTPSGVASSVFTVFAFGSPNATGIVAGDGGNAGTIDPVFGTDCGVSNSGCYRGLDRALDVSGSNIAVGAKVSFLRGAVPDPGLVFKYGNASNASNNVGDSGGTNGANDVPKTTANGNDINTAYPSTTLIQGGYDYLVNVDGTPKFTPGFHTVKIANTDGRDGGTTTTFSQPYFAANGAVSPATIGKGAQQVVVTVTGQGIRPGSKLLVQSKSVSGIGGCPADVTMGDSTVSGPAGDGTYTTISAPVTLTECIGTGATRTTMLSDRDVTIFGPDGAVFVRSGALPVHDLPTFRSIESGYGTLGQGAHVGFTPGSEVTITGTGFVGDPVFPNQAGGNPDKMTKFSFGSLVTVKTILVGTNGETALVSIDVASDATPGLRTARATNPDGGSRVVTSCVADNTNPPSLCQAGTTAPPTISAGPTIDTVTPSSFAKNQSPVTVTVKGSHFSNQINTSNVTITPAGIDFQAVSPVDAQTITFSASTGPSVTPGPRTLTIENPTDHGRVECACLGVDSLAVVMVNGATAGTPAEAPNTGSATLTLEGTDLQTVTPGSTIVATRQVDLYGQPAITGTSLTPVAVPASSNQATAAFDLTNAAPGRYNLRVVKDPGGPSQATWTCTGCLQVDSAGNVTVSSVTPATGGQGATNRLLTFTGTNFAKGMSVSIPGDVTAHHVTFVNTTTFTAQVDVANDATIGAQTITVTAGDGSSPATSTGSRDASKTFTVNVAPKVTSIAPTALGQGAGTPESGVAQTVTVSGTGLEDGVTVSLGSGITLLDYSAVTQGTCALPLPGCTPADDTFTAKIRVSQVAGFGKRPATVTNADGGVGTLADAFTVNRGPNVAGFASDTGQSVLKRDGVKRSVTVIGSFFSTADPKATLAITKLDGTAADFVKVENVVVASSSNITADVTVTAGAPGGALRVGVTNPRTGGAGDAGFGSCDTCLVLADPPGVPGALTLTPGGGSLTASWTAAAPNGSPVTVYHATIQRVGSTTTTAVDVSGSTLTTTFTGLTNGVSYVIGVRAVNAAGAGPVASATGIAGVATALTSVPSATKLTAGSPVRFSGKLVAGTAPVSGKTVALRFTPAVGTAVTRYVTTNVAGSWSYVTVAKYTFTLRAAFAGDATYRSSAAPTRLVYVAARVLRTSPTNGTTSSASTALRIAGNVYPNKAGATVYLFRYVNGTRTLMGRALVTTASNFAFVIKPPRGKYTMKIYIGASRGNLANYSAPFTLYRS